MFADTRSFDSTPIAWMDSYNAVGLGIEPLGGGRWAVGDANLARKVLANREAFYEDQPDFFGWEQSISRPTQIAIGRGTRDYLDRHLASTQISRIVRGLSPVETWPEAGNKLLAALFEHALIARCRSHDFATVRLAVIDDRIMHVEQSDLIEYRRQLYSRYFELFSEQRTQYNDCKISSYKDVIDLLFTVAPEVGTQQLAEIYLRFNLIVIGTISFALGFALLEALSNDVADAEPKRIIHETLRLYPIAWILSRKAICSHELGDKKINIGESVLVLPYAVHRHPGYWDDALLFQPQRWIRKQNFPQWIPFGAGEHTCAAVSLSISVLERIWIELFHQFEVSLGHVGEASPVGPVLAPPRFELKLRQR